MIPNNHPNSSAQPIIWTPRFTIIFFLLLAIGLSGASLLIEGWLHRYYAVGWVFLAYMLLILGSWIVVSCSARSLWVRLGGIFGGIWAIFMGIVFALSQFFPNPDSFLITYGTTAASSTLLASFICLSIAHTPLQRWDRLFFLLIPPIGCVLTFMLFLMTLDTQRSLLLLENSLTIAELWLCMAVWWLRPSCWIKQAGPTFLLGIVPLLQIILQQQLLGGSDLFFFWQVLFLCQFLAALRILQAERRHFPA